VPLNLEVTIEADNEDDASELAWIEAHDYLTTLHGDGRWVSADGDLDGIGADEVYEDES